VWRWGRVYAGTTFVGAPVANGVLRTLNWAGFHAAIVLAAAFAAVPRPFGLGVGYAKAQAEGGGVDGAASALPGGSRCWAVWLLLSLVGVVAGWRFFPRYYFQILPVVVLLAARGMAVARGWCRTVALLLLLIPVVRFAPAYYVAARDAGWRDTAMDRDSRAAARMLAAVAKPGDTLFVWGYRPEIYVYSHLPAATRFLDSQPLTGVPADRHLTQSTPVETEGSRGRRAELAGSRPSFVVDGLGEYNRRLAVTRFGDLREWMAAYRPVGRTSGCVIYRRE